MIRLLIIGLVSTLLLIPIAGFSSNVISNDIALIAVSFTLGYVVVPAILMQIWPADRRPSEYVSMEMALAKGLVSTIECDVYEVVEIEEFEDEGLHYLMSISPNRTLSLFGQYLYPYQTNYNFPSDKIRVFYNSKDGYTYGIECIGSKVKNIKHIDSPSSSAWDAGVVPSDRQIVEMSLSDVLAQIARFA